MADYQKMYSTLFNSITDVIGVLQTAQQEAEEIYMSGEDPVLIVLKPRKDDGPLRIDRQKLADSMERKGFHSYNALAKAAGLSMKTLYRSMGKTVTFKTLWKLRGELDCQWEDIL
jgi:DNA-binding Xre family transcriptional regulator